jgi:deaminated glutathione amidase
MARIAVYQARSGIDPKGNSDMLAAAVAEGAAGDAEMLFTPEMSGLLDSNRERASGSVRSEDEDGVLKAVRDAARANSIWVQLGSLALQRVGDKFVNRAFVIDNEGEIRARYDKIHLFDVDLATGESWRESAVYEGGQRAVLVRGTPVGALGLTICYDVRFPALFERLSEAGAEVISVPSAFTVPTGRAHWEILLRARAIEAGLFIVAAAQGGKHEDGRQTYGHSLVIDPWGEVLLDAGDQGGVHFAEIDLGRISEVRSRVPALKHRRPIAPVD